MSTGVNIKSVHKQLALSIVLLSVCVFTFAFGLFPSAMAGIVLCIILFVLLVGMIFYGQGKIYLPTLICLVTLVVHVFLTIYMINTDMNPDNFLFPTAQFLFGIYYFFAVLLLVGTSLAKIK